MQTPKQDYIEELLEQIGSEETQVDLTHQYELRRKLLCSSYFGVECSSRGGFRRVIGFVIPVVTGSVVVGALAFMFVITEPESLPLHAEGDVTIVASETIEEDSSDSTTPSSWGGTDDFQSFSSHMDQTLTHFADFQRVIPLQQNIQFIPAQYATTVQAQ